MSLLEKYKGGSVDRGRIGEGTYPARIVQILDLGTQKDEYKGEVSHKQKLWITFEFPEETIEIKGEQRPRWLSGEFTKSTNEKSKLYAIVQAANPEAENWMDLLDKPLLIQVGTTSGGKDKYLAAMQVPKGMPVKPLDNPIRYFDISDPDEEILNELPQFLQDKIMDSAEFKKSCPF